MASGRRPKPTKLHVLQGTRPHLPVDREPEPRIRLPRRSKHLSRRAGYIWRETGGFLLAAGVVSELDEATLATYAQTYAEIEELTLAIRREGMVLDEPVWSRKGEQVGVRSKPNPAVAIRNNLYAVLKWTATELGLTPASRPKIRAQKGTAENTVDPWDSI